MAEQIMTPDQQPAIPRRLRAVLAILLAGAFISLALLAVSRAKPAAIILSAEKTDTLIVDANGDGLPNPGDTLLYEITINNTGADTAATGMFVDAPDTNSALVVGSALTSQGMILTGNNPGDTIVRVGIGDITGFSTVTISFRVTISSSLPTSVTEIRNQGQLMAISTTTPIQVLTDDPDTATPDDSTTTPLIRPTITLEKTLVAADLDEVYPNFLTFTIAITTGPTAVDVLPLFDEYDTTYLSFVDATPYPDEDADDGLLTWNDLTGPSPNGFGGNLPPGGSFVLTAIFSVTRDITVTDNTAYFDALDEFGTLLSAEDSATVVNVPTAAELLYFRVGRVDGWDVYLKWATAVEVDNVGFKLYRAFDSVRAPAEQVAYIPSQAHGGGAVYTYIDTVPQYGTWWYWLTDVDTSGQETFQGAAETTVEKRLPTLYLPLILHETYLP
jgi:uncharacterized repeat protein (TIGR01451 family)